MQAFADDEPILHAASVQRVLVVDDDEVMRDLLSIVLAPEGYDVSTAESGDQALLQLASTTPASMPHCVLTDLRMPGISGAELGERLRKICPRSTVLLAMSGSDLLAKEAEAFDGFLLKPFGATDLQAALKRVVTGAQVVPAAATEADNEQRVALLDEAVYAKLAASMPAAQLGQLYALCLDDADVRLRRMRTAAEGGDAGLYMREAHAVKGGCGMLGATELHALAARMETGALESTPLLEEFMEAAARLRRMLEARP